MKCDKTDCKRKATERIDVVNKDTEEKIILHLCYVHALIINNAIERVINEPTQS